MNIVRQSLAFVLTFALAFPAFGESNGIGQALDSRGAMVRDLSLQAGTTLFNNDTVSVGNNGSARIALVGGSQVELLDRSVVTFARTDSAVELLLENGTASFRSQPNAPVEALIGDATVRAVKGQPAFGTIGMESPDSALVVARTGALEITTTHNAADIVVPEGSAARITLVPDPAEPQQGPIAVPAGRGLGPFSKKKLAIIALITGGGVVLLALLLGNHEKTLTNQQLQNEISPATLTN